MKVLTRTEFGNPILRAKAKPISIASVKKGAYKTFIKEMIYTMRRVGGVGIAAPQVGKSIQLAVMETRPTDTRPDLEHRGPIIIINPRIVMYSPAKKNDWEGCLSFQGTHVGGIVPRSSSVTVEYHNEKGEKVTEKASGLWARIFQHEIDHLQGITYIDRIKDVKTIMTTKEYKKRVLKKKSASKAR
ncbi:MAG: def [Parcubacteria group bacterium]|nr:def [Parcubacteria group bacterium]